MKRLVSVLIVLAAIALPAEARSKRTVIEGAPVIAGRPVERLVLLQVIHVHHSMLPRALSREHWILPGQFIPVSEDDRGVYFQAVNGMKVFVPNREPQPAPGGLYLEKASADKIYSYFGNARNSGEAIDIDGFPLTKDAIAKLKVGQAEKRK